MGLASRACMPCIKQASTKQKGPRKEKDSVPPTHPPHPSTHPGFRDKAVLLDSTFQRMGVLAALRSMGRGGQVIGTPTQPTHSPHPTQPTQSSQPTQTTSPTQPPNPPTHPPTHLLQVSWSLPLTTPYKTTASKRSTQKATPPTHPPTHHPPRRLNGHRLPQRRTRQRRENDRPRRRDAFN